MSRSTLLRLRLRAVSSRFCWLAIGSGLVAGLAVQLVAALTFAPSGAAASGSETALMASASVAALFGSACAGVLAQRVGRHAALNAYASWAAISFILMLQIAATTNVLSA